MQRVWKKCTSLIGRVRVNRVVLVGLAAAWVALAGKNLHADVRPFVFSYEATTMPAGGFEYEQWVTWKASKDTDSDFDRLDFRHELEWGVTDHFQLAFYVDWRYQDGHSVSDDGESFQDLAIEAIYNLTDPVEDPIGIALYGEYKGGDEKQVIETKLLLQKNIGKWILVWNGVFEAEWEGKHYDEDKMVLEQTAGIAYQISPSFSAGAELLHEIEYDDWEEWGDHVVYVGPNASYRGQGWWVTVAPLFQVTDVDSEADFQTRLIFGINF